MMPAIMWYISDKFVFFLRLREEYLCVILLCSFSDSRCNYFSVFSSTKWDTDPQSTHTKPACLLLPLAIPSKSFPHSLSQFRKLFSIILLPATTSAILPTSYIILEFQKPFMEISHGERSWRSRFMMAFSTTSHTFSTIRAPHLIFVGWATFLDLLMVGWLGSYITWDSQPQGQTSLVTSYDTG